MNEVDLYVLHLVFLPLINKCITEFTDSWNHHSLSTEASMTPTQLYFEGLLHVASTNANSLGQLSPSGNLDVSDITGDHVTVPRIRFSPCPMLKLQLDVIDPLQTNSINGIALYTTTVQLVGQHLTLPCNQCTITN